MSLFQDLLGGFPKQRQETPREQQEQEAVTSLGAGGWRGWWYWGPRAGGTWQTLEQPRACPGETDVRLTTKTEKEGERCPFFSPPTLKAPACVSHGWNPHRTGCPGAWEASPAVWSCARVGPGMAMRQTAQAQRQAGGQGVLPGPGTTHCGFPVAPRPDRGSALPAAASPAKALDRMLCPSATYIPSMTSALLCQAAAVLY